jgi:NhaP-type Na+/H+ or K+/H+ antiporter
VLEQIGYGTLAGVVAGIAAACVVVIAGGRGQVGGSWLQVVPLAGAALAFGIADPIGGSGFIAAFVGGFVFGAIQRRSGGGEVGYLLEELGEVLNAVTFIVFGAVLLGPVLGDMTWSIALYAVLSLTIVRLIPVAIAMIGTGARRQTVAFLGWFGPRGLASIVFAVLVLEEGGLPHDGLILTTTFFTIGLSVLAHGLTATPLANRYATWYESHPREALPGESSESRRFAGASASAIPACQTPAAPPDAAATACRPVIRPSLERALAQPPRRTRPGGAAPGRRQTAP